MHNIHIVYMHKCMFFVFLLFLLSLLRHRKRLCIVPASECRALVHYPDYGFRYPDYLLACIGLG